MNLNINYRLKFPNTILLSMKIKGKYSRAPFCVLKSVLLIRVTHASLYVYLTNNNSKNKFKHNT